MGQVTYEPDSAPETTDAAQNVAPVEEDDESLCDLHSQRWQHFNPNVETSDTNVTKKNQVNVAPPSRIQTELYPVLKKINLQLVNCLESSVASFRVLQACEWTWVVLISTVQHRSRIVQKQNDKQTEACGSIPATRPHTR